MKTLLGKCLPLLLVFALLTACTGQPVAPPTSSDPVSDPEPGQKPAPELDLSVLDQGSANALMEFMQQANDAYYLSNENERMLSLYAMQRAAAIGAAAQKTDLAALSQSQDITAVLSSFQTAKDPTLLYLRAGNYTLSGEVTLPSCVALQAENGACVQLTENAVLTLGGLLEAPYNARIFTGGTVRLNADGQIAFATWFGAVGDGISNDTAAVQAALNACNAVCLPYTAGGYLVGQLNMTADSFLFGNGSARSVLIAAGGTDVLLCLNGSDIGLRHLELRLKNMAVGSAAILLDNAQNELRHIELRDLCVTDGYNIVRDIGGGRPITDLRLYEVDCRDTRDTTVLLRDCKALLYMRHCVTDYNVKTLVYKQDSLHTAYQISGCTGVLMQQCDVLGSYTNDEARGNHAFVLENCAAVLLEREYSDTLSGMGFWLKDVQYGTLRNCGSGLNNDIGLLMERCSRIAVTQFKQFGRWELGGIRSVDGIVLRDCSNVTLENVQSLCNLGDAMVLQDSTAVTVTNYTSYINSGKAFVEAGNSNANLVNGLTTVYNQTGVHTLIGTDSAICGILYNEGGYNPSTVGSYTDQVGTYTAVSAPDRAQLQVDTAVLQQAYNDAFDCLYDAEQLLQQAQQTRGNGIPAVLPSGVDVTQFGAVGDGTTDDTAAILRAMESATDLYFPSGTYRIAGRIVQTAQYCFTFASDASLLIDESGKLVLNGAIRADAHRIFRGDTTGLLGNDYGYPQWFGAVGDGTTDDTAAFTAALQRLRKVCVPYTENGYVVGELRLSGDRTLCGIGDKQPVLKAKADTQKWIRPATGCRLYDLTLDMQAAGDTAVCLYFNTNSSGYEKIRVYNLTVIQPGSFIADADSGNKYLVGNIHFDNISVLRPRNVALRMTDFFGFVFFRNVTVDYQGAVADHDAFYVQTNYGMIVENCTVRDSAKGSSGAAYRFCDSWAIWADRCTAQNVGGAGFVTDGIRHCYLSDCTAQDTAAEGFCLSGMYFQVYGITASNTAGVLLHDGHYLTFSGITVPQGEITVRGCNVICINGINADKLTETQGNFLLCIDPHQTEVSLQGIYSASKE